jgi:acyl-CoA synthetase (AMP-forming)/AMP-acid ligase II
VTVEELQAYSAARLAGHKRPKGYTVLASLPRNSMGKVLRREVRDQLEDRTDEGPGR